MIDIATGIKRAQSLFMMGFEEYSIPAIIEVLELADDIYFNGDDEIMSDAEYDSLKRYAQLMDPTNPYFLGIGSEIRGSKVKLPFEMGSLDQAYEGDITKWIQTNNLKSYLATVSDKLDGTSGMAIYDNTGKYQIGYSRGDGVMGADISRHHRQMPSVPKQISLNEPISVRGENIISVANFRALKPLVKSRSGKPYKNPRNAAAGLMNASTNPGFVYQYVEFVAYEIVGSLLGKKEQLELLKSLGFKVVHYETMEFSNMTDASLTEYLRTRREVTEYEIDGVVIDVDSADKRSDMNPTRATLNPAYSRKFKVASSDNIAEAEVTDVDINISKDGYLKPRVNIKPVDLMGVTVQWATGFNMKFIIDNKVGPGAKIIITRSGDVIPFIMSVSQPMEGFSDWIDDKVDEFGDTMWTPTKVDLVLVNPHNNETVKYRQLVDFFNAIEAPHLGEGNLKKIFDVGFETPEDIIELTQEDFGSIIGSYANGKKIFDGLRKSLINIPLYKLMGAHPAFGRGVGIRKMRALYDAFKGDMSKCESLTHITYVEGFDTKTATKVQRGYPVFLDFYNKVKKYITVAPYESPKDGKLNGKAVVFTGFRDKALQSEVENAGGKVGSSVSGKTNILVCADPKSESGKPRDARSLNSSGKANIEIMSIDEFKRYLHS